MPALHVVVQPLPGRAPHPSLAPVYGLFDVVVDGVNITARIGEVQAVTLLCDFTHAFARLLSGQRVRQTLQLQTDPETWEIGLESDGEDVLLTVYRERPTASVAVWERRVKSRDLYQALSTALDDLRSATPGQGNAAALRGALLAARRILTQHPPASLGARKLETRSIPPCGDTPFRLGASVTWRRFKAHNDSASSRLETADLHSLLFQGTLAFELLGQQVQASRSHLFVDTEQLLTLCQELWTSVEARRPIFRRAALSRAFVTLRWAPEGDRLELRVRCADPQTGREKTAFAELPARAFCSSVSAFAQALGDACIANDTQQARNLRLSTLLRQVAALKQRIDEQPDDETLTNPDPASYRTFPLAARPRRASRWDHGGKMRFVPRWVATVPSIDLASSFLCGDRLLIGSHRETACLDRQSGHILWRQATPRARCIVSPSGLLRIEPDGHLSCFDLANGDCRFDLMLAPRPGASQTGSVVDMPGLPKLFAVTEGDRQITAIDLHTGRVRWRYTAPRATALRTRRAGKLLLIAGKDPTLVALDIATGEVVWRVRRDAPFTGEIALDKDSIFALTGGQDGAWSLLHINAWTGAVCWESQLEDHPLLGRSPVVTSNVVAIAARDDQGTALRGFARNTGALLWQHGPGLAAPLAAWLAVDDAILGNTAAGILLCLDAATGTPRYSHVFAKSAGGDQPRRLEPILRSGALFVPQQQVHVLRPRDGELLGTLPCDLIPDLIRVDERCDVYVCEESGHVAAFAAAARLTLVK